MKNYQTSMSQLNENRLKTAKHMEAFAKKSPFEDVVSPPIMLDQAVTGTEARPAAGEGGRTVATDDAVADEGSKNVTDQDEVKEEGSKEDAEASGDGKSELKENESSVASDEKPAPTTEQEEVKTMGSVEPVKADLDSFAGVHQSFYELSKRHHEQYNTYLLKYVEDWERVISQRIHGLLIHYRELQENAVHYKKKLGGLIQKVDRSQSVRQKLAEKLDRNEIKEMGAEEARDTVGEHLYLYIEEVMQRAWRDVFPLLLRSCRFEAEFSAASAGTLANLLAVAESVQRIGEDEECAEMGRLENLEKNHPEEIYTEENPFVKLTPRKKRAGSESGSVVSDEAHGVEPTSESPEGTLKEV
jgi:hypothetical protein